jgi:RimJ/RimL family protein N-acetyltransferase
MPFAPLLAGRWARLEPLTTDHVQGLIAAASGPRDSFVWTHVPGSAEEMRAYVERAIAHRAEGRSSPFATIDARTGVVVGSTRFCNIERWDWLAGSPHLRPPGGMDGVEIGWTWLHPEAQRSGVNTEAKRLMLAHAFEVWRVHRVTLKTDARNARSRAAIERIGGKLDGLLRGHMPGADGTVRTSAIYSILADEWPTVRDRLDARLRRAG